MSQVKTALSPTVIDAIRTFAAALNNTPQFTAFEDCAGALESDQSAKDAIDAFQSKQQMLQVMFQLNAVSEEEQSALEQLRQAVIANATVTNYVDAQDELIALCQASASLLSEKIGLRFSVKRGGCCG